MIAAVGFDTGGGSMRFVASTLLLLCFLIQAHGAVAVPEEPTLHRPPDRSILERARPDVRIPPTGLEIVNPAEFCRADGVLLPWPYWGQELIASVARAVADDYRVYMVVRDASGEASAFNYLSSYGVNIDNVEFIHDPRVSSSSMWIRDYGPFCIYEDGREAIVDFYYGTYQGDDDIPESIASYFSLPYYHSDLLHHGGNHITDGNGMGFCSTNIWEYNNGFTEAEIREVFRDYLGIDSLVVYEPMRGDLTGHTDMFCKLLSDSLFLVGEYADPADCYPGDYELLNDLADHLATVRNLDGRPFTVARIPMGPYDPDGPYCAINRTYTNSLIINDKVLVPVYGAETDSAALAIYAALMPCHEIIGIDSEFIIQYAGAVHCMTNCIHSANPLIVFHVPISEVPLGSAPRIDFTINPRFENTSASVHYKPTSEEEFTEAPAAFENGVWSAELPEAVEDFSYYISGLAVSGFTVFDVTLPEGAPGAVFDVTVEPAAAVTAHLEPRIILRSFPNPFRRQTTISFDVPVSEPVSARVFDASGRLVRTLVDGAIYAGGRHHVVWSGLDGRGRPVSPGIYLFRLEAGAGSGTERAVLLR
jgi:agmatine/peptidylarginine deiminase